MLADFSWKICVIYLNDVIIFEKIFEEKIINLKKVFLYQKNLLMSTIQ